VVAKLGRRISDLTIEERREYQRHEMPIRFGSPLLSKLQAKYWELEHCRQMPFVIAIEAFHDDDSLGITDSVLAGYLFGLQQKGAWDGAGQLVIETQAIKEHVIGEKVVPSNFFEQPGGEHVSAIVFTNSGTFPKFSRMGYQHGIGNDTVDIIRTGFCFNPDRNAADPTFFTYTLDEPPLVEPWGQGLVVLQNPKSLHPVPRDFFIEASQGYLEDGRLKFEHPGWHPFSSKTMIVHLGDVKREMLKRIPQHSRAAIGAISRDEFRAACGIVTGPAHPIFDEEGWFADETESFFGVVVRDKVDDDWGYVVLARDKLFRLRAIETEVSMKTRDEARMRLQVRIMQLVSAPRRIFDQGD
jgi:hypothetical protein